jgi:hypothetical protein
VGEGEIDGQEGRRARAGLLREEEEEIFWYLVFSKELLKK